jgi:hypothetical protein
LAKPNYGFEKRQRELAKKQKKEAKRLKKKPVDAVGSGSEAEATRDPAASHEVPTK